MNYQEAMSQDGWDAIALFWPVGLLFVGWIIGRYADWIRPK